MSAFLRLALGQILAPLPSAASFGVSRRLFAHGLGLIFFLAFGSLALQVQALFGARGIAPVAEFLPAVRGQLGAGAYWQCPTLFWLGSSDGALTAACWAGMALALVLASGRWAGPCCLLLWALYLSFCTVGSPFLNFQWDALLLETALPAAVLLPWRGRPEWGRQTRVSRLGRWLLWWLLARLMLESAIVKLSSGDPTWRGLTAMTFHYETQPLPLWTAWYAHHAPLWVHQAEVLATFAIEFLTPLALLGPRSARHLAAVAVILLQAAIAATGNYAFFNLLTALLAVPLLDDAVWPAQWRRRLLGGTGAAVPEAEPSLASRLLEPLGAASAALTGVLLLGTLRLGLSWPAPVESVLSAVAPLRSFNSYGLFAVMTTARLEIEVQGSQDGVHWHAYAFRWKPGDPRQRPRLVAPHQPRLDWQMWFAALGSYQQNPWLIQFLVRLLQGEPEVKRLLAWNPFPDQPPKYLRAVGYEYHFTAAGAGSAWWRREEKGLYCPVISLKEEH